MGFVNHGCFARFDVGATPRVLRVFTPTVESAGALASAAKGSTAGCAAPALAATLYRGATPVLGVCGEKDCQASNMGAETLGCYSRPGAGGDGVSGKTQATQLAVAYSDATHFGCALDALAGGLTGGFFNVSLHGSPTLSTAATRTPASCGRGASTSPAPRRSTPSCLRASPRLSRRRARARAAPT